MHDCAPRWDPLPWIPSEANTSQFAAWQSQLRSAELYSANRSMSGLVRMKSNNWFTFAATAPNVGCCHAEPQKRVNPFTAVRSGPLPDSAHFLTSVVVKLYQLNPGPECFLSVTMTRRKRKFWCPHRQERPVSKMRHVAQPLP